MKLSIRFAALLFFFFCPSVSLEVASIYSKFISAFDRPGRFQNIINKQYHRDVFIII